MKRRAIRGTSKKEGKKKKFHISHYLVILSLLVISFFSFFVISQFYNEQIQASTLEQLLSFEQINGANNTTITTLVNIDPNTGVKTTIGNSIETTIPGFNDVSLGSPSIDSAGHRIFYFNKNENQNTQVINVVAQDTLTGAVNIISQFPTSSNFVTNPGVRYVASTNQLLAFEQINGANNTTITTLVNIDPNTGVKTTIGNSIETTIPGFNDVSLGSPSIDSAGHRIFYFNKNENQNTQVINVVAQDTLTGAVNIISQFPTSSNFVTNPGVTFQEPIANPTPTNSPTPTITPTPSVRVPPTKDACKGDGWRNLTDNNGKAFKNQGACTSVFNHK